MIQKSKVPYIEQMTETECGLCCCVSILHYFGSKEEILDLRKEKEKGRDGYSLRDLKDYFTSRGISASSYRVATDTIKQLPLPLIAFWDNKHFVVAYKVKSNTIYVMDPAKGYNKYTYEEFSVHFSDVVLLVSPTENYSPRDSSVPSPWKVVTKSFFGNKKGMFLALVFSIISYFITLLVPHLTSKIIDTSVNGMTAKYFHSAMVMVVIVLFLYLFSIFFRNIGILISNLYFSYDIEKSTFRHLLKLPYGFFELRAKGDILYRISSLSGFRDLFTNQVVSGIVDLGMVFTVFIYMFYHSATIAVCSLILSLLNILFLFSTKNILSDTVNRELQEQSLLYSVENEALNTISSIKISGLEDEIYQNWFGHLKNVLSKYRIRTISYDFFTSVTGAFQIFAPIVVLMIGLWQYQQSKESIGEIVAFQSLASILFSSEMSIFNSYTQFVLAAGYLKRVNDIWVEEEDRNLGKEQLRSFNGNVTVNNLSFSYSKNSEDVLHNVSLSIRSGEKVAIVGKSGSGKSTIGKILAGLYTTKKNTIYFDEYDLSTINKKSLSSQIGVVPQDVYLLNRSIMDNIRLNNISITEEKIIEACKAVQIYDEISSMPMGLHTIVSEMGLNLSGGQRQRIALARALIDNPKLVILDEATSALDSMNEHHITEYLRRQGCTQIIIAHRLSTIADADRIYVLKDGVICEVGNHAELMSRKGEYYQLYLKNCQ